MATAKLTTKGQITLPKEVRTALALRTGDEVEFFRENGTFHVKKRVDPGVFAKYRGYLKHLKGQDVDELISEMRGE